jgi:hypothetical protein
MATRTLRAERRQTMKVNVRANNGQTVQVNVSAYERLTPASAVAAADIAFGSASHCTVSVREDGKLAQYRVTGLNAKRRARREV